MFFCKFAAVRPRYWALCALASLALLSSPRAFANTPPTISGSPPTRVVAAHWYEFEPSGYDSDRDTLRFSISNKPAWLSFNSSTGRLYGVPIPPGNVGTFSNIGICVSDGRYRRCLPKFALTVKPLADIPPVISGTTPATATVGAAYSFQPAASDPNGLRIDFGIWAKPAWLTFDSNTGRLYGTPAAADVGTYSNIVISVYNGYYSAHLPAFSIAVSAQAAQLPPGTVTINWTPPTANTDGSTLTDLAGYHLYYGTSQSNLSNVVNITNPGLASYVMSNLSAGTWYFALTSLNTSGVESPRTAVMSTVVQ